MDEISALTGNVSDEAKSSTRFFRAPLLWILFPQCAAYILCECGFSFSPKASLIAAGIALLAALLAGLATLIPAGEKHAKLRNDLWVLALPIAAFFLAGAWWSACAPRPVDWRGKPESEIVVEATVETPFRSAGQSRSGLARVTATSEGGESLCGGRILYRFRKSETDTELHEGMRLRMRGIVRDIADDSWFNSGFRDFLRSRRVSVLLGNGDNIEILNSNLAAEIRGCFARLKAELTRKLVDPRSPQEREQRILAAMLLGERKLLPPEQENDFMLTGTMHIFAVSGLHVSLFAALLFAVFSRFRTPYRVLAAAVLLVTGFYVLLTGAAPSAVRAWTMVAFLLAARLLGRSSNPLNALTLAASVTLWQNPSLLSSLGFQLSYGVVASIFLYGIPLGDFLNARIRPFKYIPVKSRSRFRRLLASGLEKLVALFAVSFGTFIAGAVFITGSFGIFTPIAVLVNLILVPYIGLLLALAIASAALFCLPGTDWAAAWLWAADCRLMFAVEVLTGTAAAVPAELTVQFPQAWLGTLGGGLISAFFIAGAFIPALRSRAWLRFGFPPAFLCAYLLAFAR